ncbi:hypothetical protein QJS10_CPB15g01011 [Acorus calamus]|uniref:Uncharacterized protein n=1 Tax=Acorus calamus TaxID=4465 RepID=A0AAV9DA24_ACOCL|nr:hypothetical protein QJS10_CPB15g01011 [Acorus calamus]
MAKEDQLLDNLSYDPDNTNSPTMWFPGVVAQYSLFRALHEKEIRIKGSLTAFQFFLIATA